MIALELLDWCPIPETARALGHVRVGGGTGNPDSGVRFSIEAVVAVAEVDGVRLVAPALLLRPRLRRAFDPAAVKAAVAAWMTRRNLPTASLFLPGTDADGFLQGSAATQSAWRDFRDECAMPLLDLASPVEERVRDVLRSTLARRPWALLGAGDTLGDIYPLLSGMDPVDRAFTALVLFRAAAPAEEPQQAAGRPVHFAAPSADLDLLLVTRTLRLKVNRRGGPGGFAVAARSLLPGPPSPFPAEDMEDRATAWTRAFRDLTRADFEPGERALLQEDFCGEPDPFTTQGPFLTLLVPDLARTAGGTSSTNTSHLSGSLDAWLASGRARRMLFVVAAGEPMERLEGPASDLLAPAGEANGAHLPPRAAVSAEVEE